MPPDPDAQVQLALDNMKQTLAAAGMDFRHVVFVNPYMTDKASRQMNDIYAKHFEFGNTPARATIRVTSLPGGNTIEFTGVAVTDLSKRLAVRPKNMSPSATASPCVFADDTYYCSAKGPFTPGLRGEPAGHLGRDRRNTGSADDAEPARRVGGSRVGALQRGGDQRVPGRHQRLRAHEPDLRAVLFRDAARTHDRGADRAGGSHARNEDTYPGLEQISLIAVK